MVYVIRTEDRVLDFARSRKTAKKKRRKKYAKCQGVVIETFPELIADIIAEGLRESV